MLQRFGISVGGSGENKLPITLASYQNAGLFSGALIFSYRKKSAIVEVLYLL